MREAVVSFQRRLAGAAAVSAIGGLGSLVLTTAATLLVARATGPEGYAVFVTANLLLFVGSIIASFGLPLAMARFLGEHDERLDDRAATAIASTATAIGVGAALVFGIVVALLLGRIEDLLGVRLGRSFALLLPVALAFAVISDIAQSAHYAMLRPHAAIVVTSSGPAAMVAYIAVDRFADLSLPVWGAVVTSYCVSGLVGLVSLYRLGLIGRLSNRDDSARLLRETPSAGAYTVFSSFGAYADRTVAGLSLGAVALGGYSSATILVQSALRAPSYVGFLLIAANRRAASREASLSFERKMVAAFGLFAAVATVPLVIAPTFILGHTFGPGFEFMEDPLRLMAPSILASALSIPFISALMGSERHNLVGPLLVGTAVPRLILLAVMTNAWGLAGTAVATTIAEIALAALSVIIGRRADIQLPVAPVALPCGLAIGACALGYGLRRMGVAEPVAAAAAVLMLAPFAVRLVLSMVRS